MLDPKLIPTPLLPSDAKPVVRIGQSSRSKNSRFLHVLVNLTALVVRVTWLKATGRLAPQILGEQLADFCRKTGVLWIKVGQLLSMRPDLLPSLAGDELAQLQDLAEGLPFETTKRVVEEELKAPLSHHFDEFEAVPVAAASIAQVHRARLRREGVWVAVKVQMPHADSSLQRDLRLVRAIVWLLVHLRIRPYVRWEEMLWELESILKEELDFRFEVSNMRRMRKTLRKHSVYVPKVFQRYSTRRLLIMEYVEGVTIAEYIRVAHSEPSLLKGWLSGNNISTRRVSRRLLSSFLRQSLEDNLFHGDLHPGNVVLLRDSRIALIDFGCVGFNDRDLLRKVDLYIQALTRGQYSKMADLYLLCADRLPPRDLSDAKEEFIRVMQAWERSVSVKDLPYTQKSMSVANDELIRVLGRYGVAPVWGFLRQTRGLYTADASVRELSPESDMTKLLRRYYRKKEARLRKQFGSDPTRSLLQFDSVLEAPVLANEYVMFRGAVVRRLARVFAGTSTKIAALFARLFDAGRLLTGFFLAWLVADGLHILPANFEVLLWYSRVLNLTPHLDLQVWILIAAYLWYLYRTLSMLKREFVKDNTQSAI